MTKWILALALLVIAPPAWAGWVACPGDSSDTNTNAPQLSGGSSMCVRQTTATDPQRIDATRCKGAGLDIVFQAVAGTFYDASVLVYQCSTSGTAGVFTDCKLAPVDRDGDGAGDGLPLTGDEASLQNGIYGLPPDWYAFDVTNGSSRDIQLKAICR